MPVLDAPLEELQRTAQDPSRGPAPKFKSSEAAPPTPHHPNYRNLQTAHRIILQEDGQKALNQILAKEKKLESASDDPHIRSEIMDDARVKHELSDLHRPMNFNSALNQHFLDQANDFIGEKRLTRDVAHQDALYKDIQARRTQYMQPDSTRNVVRGMDPDKQQAWFQDQLQLTIKDMRAKGISVDEKHIVSPMFPDSINDALALKDDYFGVPWGAFDMLTAKEFRVLLAHEIRHTQQPDSMSDTMSEKDADLTAARVYGSKATAAVLQKVLPNIPKRSDDPHQSKQGRISYVLAADYPDAKPAAPARRAKHTP